MFDRSVAMVEAGQPSLERGDDVPGDGPGGIGNRGGGDRWTGVAAEERGDAAFGHITRDTRDINEELIHADAPGHGATLTIDEDVAGVAERAAPAIRIADGDEGEA